MARMSIDDMVQRDPRVTLLAIALGWSRRETLGCLVGEVWPICYDQRSWLVSERVIDAAAGFAGFAAALIECELATRDRSGKVQIRGAKERISYLENKSRSGRQGGLRSAESRNKETKQTSSTAGSTPQAPRNPPVPDPASAPVPDKESGDSPGLAALVSKVNEVVGDVGRKRAEKALAKAHPDQQAVIDGFHQRYKAKYGTKPTWGPKTIGQVGLLLKKHRASTLFERMDFMFAGRAKWPPGPYSLDVFIANLDRWVDDSTPAAPIRKEDEL
jgi:hypothetical protein